MGNMTFYDYSLGYDIPVGDMCRQYPGCYFDRSYTVHQCQMHGYQNPEWDVQSKILENADGYFDFSKNIIDVGAYIGIYRWNLPFRKAWLFEPNRESYMLCCANAALHGRVRDTFIYNEIVSNEHAEMMFNGYDGMGHREFGELALKGNEYYETPRPMTSVTLDDYHRRFEDIGFIKTDCEGMDWKVLDGARKTIIANGYPPILFENWPDYDESSWWGPGWANRETPEEIEVRNRMIREVLEGMGYDILWAWVPEHPDIHLAVHK